MRVGELEPLLQSRRKAGSWLSAVILAVAAIAAICLCVFAVKARLVPQTVLLEANFNSVAAARGQSHLARAQQLAAVEFERPDLGPMVLNSK